MKRKGHGMASRKKGTKRGSRKLSLAGFFRALWKKPELLDRFSAGADQRADVLRQFNLEARHRKLLEQGCVRDIIQELAGVKAGAARAENTVIYAANEVSCGHPECRAFMASLKPR